MKQWEGQMIVLCGRRGGRGETGVRTGVVREKIIDEEGSFGDRFAAHPALAVTLVRLLFEALASPEITAVIEHIATPLMNDKSLFE
jgi:hypothetical protein